LPLSDMSGSVNNFTVIESVYGRFVVNRHCAFQAEYLIKTGLPHIESELRSMLAIVKTLAADSVVVDAGANIGLVSVPVAQAIKDRSGVVHAFEVQRMMFYALCGAAALNDLTNIHAHHLGVGARSQVLRVPMVDYGKPQDFGALSLTVQDPIAEAETVDIVALDGFNLSRLDFLKIDVEGMEIEVLGGATRMIATFEPWCWVEHWITGPDAIKRQFEGLAYDFYLMDKLNMLCAPRSRLASSGVRINGERL
jgi:FkbM family methyltransferase